MFTAYQLANRVNKEYPNNGFIFETEVGHETNLQQGFVEYINSSLNRLNKLVLLDDNYEILTIAGQALYKLPSNCEQNNVLEVTRDYGNPKTPIRCVWARDAEIIEGTRYFNGYNNTIGLFPVPAVDNERVKLFYKRTPRAVQTKDDPIEIIDKYIDLLVYAIVADMASAGSNPDIEISNNYSLKYNTLLEEIKAENFNGAPFYPKTKDNKRPPLSWIRRGRF